MRFFTALFSLLLVSGTLRAQADRGTVRGTLTDSSGAAVTGASLTLQNQATNLSYNAVSSTSGSYSFLNLPIGAYTLTTEAKGFERQAIKGIIVQVNQVSNIDVPLKLGAVNQTVDVQAVTPMIQSEATDVGTVIDNKRFNDLPLDMGGGIRNPSSFIFLSPGVNGSTWEKHIGGGGSFSDQVYYDGIALSRGDLSNDGEVSPSVDAVEEFKLISNNYSAEYAHALGGVTSYTMKSGTNSLHGNAFEFNDNNHFDARGFYSPTKAYRNQNEFGFTLGGPVVIPKLYNGRDKTFFFVSLDQYFIRGGQLAGLETVPTPEMLQGNFSHWPEPIYDPRSTTVSANGTVARTQFPGNIIPKTQFSSVSNNMIQYQAAPTLPGVTDNAVAPLLSPTSNQRTYGFKIDHVISEKHHLSGMYNVTQRPSIKSPGPAAEYSNNGSSALENFNLQDVSTVIARINEDWTVTPSLVNHLGIGFSRFNNANFSLGLNQGWLQPNGGKLGLTGLQSDLFPTVTFSQNYTTYGDPIAGDDIYNTFTALDNVTWIKGKHTLKLGFELQAHQDNYNDFGNGGGTFAFSQLETGLPGNSTSGNAYASFLLGAVDNANAYFRSSLPGGRYKYYGSFVDDTYKVTPKLTLNLGVRWEVVVPTSDPYGRISYMDPSIPNPDAGNLLGGYVFGGKGTGRDGFNRFFDINYRNLAPRIGFAYSPTKNWVIRSGYGIFYGEYTSNGVGVPSDGFSLTPKFLSPDSGVTPAFYWDGGFPQNFPHPPIISPGVSNGLNATLLYPSLFADNPPYSQQWNFTIEHQLSESLMISAAYVANKSTHLIDQNTNFNQLNPAYFSLGTALLTANINSPAAQAAGYKPPFPGFSQLFGAQATVAQSLLRFPQYQNVTEVGGFDGNSSYHSFQLKMDKRFSKGPAATFAYTRSKYLADDLGFTSPTGSVSIQNYDAREKFVYPTDQPNLVSFSFNYAIPYGSGSQSGIGRKILGGWSVSAIASYGSGFPIQVYSSSNDLSFGYTGGLLPNLTGAPLLASRTGNFNPNSDRYLNTAAFAQPGALQFGNAPLYLPVRTPFAKSESFGLFKNTRITERLLDQFRVEMQNPFNRVVFGSPVADIQAPNFGYINSQANVPREIQFGMKLIW